ncbi:hypothetical protein ACJX0J_018608, partial [Zea mays]
MDWLYYFLVCVLRLFLSPQKCSHSTFGQVYSISLYHVNDNFNNVLLLLDEKKFHEIEICYVDCLKSLLVHEWIVSLTKHYAVLLIPIVWIDGKAALLGFVGAPWTIATYIVEGGMTNTYTNIKNMCHTAPDVLRCLLSHLAEAISDYIIYQVNSGAQCIQIFDSWGGQLPPHVWEQWSKPYIKKIVNRIKKECPHVPLVLYINGNGGLLERMKDTRVDVIGLDWTVDMADGRKRLGNGISVQGNVDPAFLFSPLPVLTDEIR